MESALLQTKCGACGKVENEIKFQVCPICIELKMLPSVYCCEECFGADWKTHKKKHDEFSNAKTEFLERHPIKKASKESYRKRAKRMTRDSKIEITPYAQLVFSIDLAMDAMDHDTAETLCRKAISRFPSYPEPYEFMTSIYKANDKLEDAMRFLEISMEKTCHLLLTVENKSNVSDEPLLSHYLQRKKFVDKMNLIFICEKTIESTVEPNIFIADWIVDRKKFMSLWWYYLELVKDIDSMYGDPELLYSKHVTSPIESTRLMNQRSQEFDNNISLSPFYDGEWVIAHGLTSSVGKNLNHRVAMVKGDELNEEGRVAVAFEEGGPIKNLKVENLKYARTVNIKAALLLFLDESEQWKFMMDNFLAV